MRVLVDATALGSGLGGDETMLRGLLRGLARTVPSPDDEVEVLATPSACVPPEVGGHPQFTVTRVRPLPGPAHFGARLPLALRRRGPGPDLVFTVTHGPLATAVPGALMVQDLSFHHHPEFYPRASRLRLNALVGHQVRRSAVVLTVSDFCRHDLIDTYGLAPERVHTVPNTIDVTEVAPGRLEAAQGRLAARGVDGPYLLYLGNLHPRKNVARTIDGFARARRAGHLDGTRLVVAGARWWGEGEEAAAARAPGGSVTFLGRVDDDERAQLLKGARALVYVSRFEGFGLPPLEAMAMGTPVLASSVTAMPEVCGDAAVLVDPLDVEAIAEGMATVVNDEARRAAARRRRLPAGRPPWRRAHRPRRLGRLRLGGGGSRGRDPMNVVSPAPTSSPPPTGPPPPPAPAPRRPRRWGRVLLAIGAVLAVVVVVAVAGLAYLLRNWNTPARVPADYRPPAALPASAPVAPGELAFDSDRTGNFEVFTMAPDGTGVRQLTNDPAWDSWWPRLSPDRRTIIFYRTPAGTHDRNFTRTALWAVAPDGSAPVLVRPAGLDGWPQQGHAEWSPDGSSLVMFGGRNRSSPQIFVTDRLGQSPRPVTDRPGSNLDPSFAPDGRTIVFVGCPGRFCTPSDQEVYTVPTTGGEVTRLTRDAIRDNDPYYAPDGSRLAWLSQTSGGLPGVWDIRVAGADGADPRRLVDDGNVNSRPQWSADSRTIYFHRLVPGSGSGFQIWAIRSDGSGLHEITTGQPGTSEYPSDMSRSSPTQGVAMRAPRATHIGVCLAIVGMGGWRGRAPGAGATDLHYHCRSAVGESDTEYTVVADAPTSVVQGTTFDVKNLVVTGTPPVDLLIARISFGIEVPANATTVSPTTIAFDGPGATDPPGPIAKKGVPNSFAPHDLHHDGHWRGGLDHRHLPG